VSNFFKVRGNSGCEIIIKNNIVRKISVNKKYNNRLREQCRKQREFTHSTPFRVPRVFSEGKNLDKYYFEMEFIPYKTFDRVFNFADKRMLDHISDKIIMFINSNISGKIRVNREVVIKKYEATKNKIRSKNNIDLSYLNGLFYSLEEIIEIPSGKCHGDLTFSNLLFDGADIVALDFLDTYLESPLQDITKIRQDTDFYWSLRRIEKVHDELKIKQCLKYIDKKIENQFSKFEFYKKYYKTFQILNFMRIIPYCTDQKDIYKLKEWIDKLCLP